ncbi:ribonuclease E/G, partial [uncultured Sphingorhabdus sp.]|uniref:ribonuclease E/G n=1 Tax=uncultured Sphingorhabdus sp. TaxID=1686106 RepID=UPI00262D81B6
MTCTLLWDAAPGEIRAGLVEDGALTEFRIIRPSRRGSYLAVGQLYTARIVENQGAGRALVTLGGGLEAHLERAQRVPEGTLLAVEIVRTSIPEPGRWKPPLVKARSDLVANSSEGPFDIGKQSWAYFLDEWRGKVDRIICCDATAMQQVSTSVGPDGPPVSADIAAIEEADFDSVVESAVTGEFTIKGGMLTIERTRAMTTIDIDGSGDPIALNLAAALEIPRLLRLLDIGGQGGIDFLALRDRFASSKIGSGMQRLRGALQRLRLAVDRAGLEPPPV